jgi:hypothetical protein
LRKLIALSTYREVVQRMEYQAARSLPIPTEYPRTRLDALDDEVAGALGEVVTYGLVPHVTRRHLPFYSREDEDATQQ